jgi:hypothetical protein
MTIASANYLPYVKTLMQSLRDTNPTYRRYLVLVDKKSLEELDCGDLFEVIEADALGIESFDDMTIRYDVMELNTAVKPFAIEWLFDNTDASSVMYLDPDICVYRRLNELESLLEGDASVVVTPHLTQPLEDGKLPNDHHMLQAGVFNLGFIAINRAQEAREFVRWWGRRLKTHGYSDVGRNLFTDQRWIDLAPCFLANLAVFRDHAYNVAYWNLMQRPVKKRRGKLVYGDRELAFFHFSGLDRSKPRVVSKHQDRLKWKDIEPYQELFNSYRAALTANGWETQSKSAYIYDRIGDLKVSSVIRHLYRDLYPDVVSGHRVDERFLIAMCNAPAGLAVDEDGRITRLMHSVYRRRPDLQAAFSLTGAEGIAAFRHWFEVSAPREYGLDERLANPVDATRQAIAEVALPPPAPAFADRHPNDGKPLLFRKWRKVRKWLIERL